MGGLARRMGVTMSNDAFKDNAVILTGASSGIGREVARQLAEQGAWLGKSPVREAEVMSAEECARILIAAMTQRKREEVMTRRGKLGQWLKLIAPGMVDKAARRTIEEGK